MTTQVLEKAWEVLGVLPQNERNMVIILDEMSIQSRLSYSDREGRIVGLVATHVIAFVVRALFGKFKIFLESAYVSDVYPADEIKKNVFRLIRFCEF